MLSYPVNAAVSGHPEAWLQISPRFSTSKTRTQCTALVLVLFSATLRRRWWYFALAWGQTQQTKVLTKEQGNWEWPPESLFCSRGELFPRPSPVCFPVATAKLCLCRCPASCRAGAAPLRAVVIHITAEARSSGAVLVFWGSMGQKDGSIPREFKCICQCQLLLLFFPVLPGKCMGLGPRLFLQPGLQRFVPKHSHPTGLPCPGGLLKACLWAWVKPCHQSMFIQLLILSQLSAGSLHPGSWGTASWQHTVVYEKGTGGLLLNHSVPHCFSCLTCDWFIFPLVSLSSPSCVFAMQILRTASDRTPWLWGCSPSNVEDCPGTLVVLHPFSGCTTDLGDQPFAYLSTGSSNPCSVAGDGSCSQQCCQGAVCRGFGGWKLAWGGKMSRLILTIKLSAGCAEVFKYWCKHRRNSCLLPEWVKDLQRKTSQSSLPTLLRSQLFLCDTSTW